MKEKPPVIEPVEMTEQDIELAEQAAQRLGYTQTAYTSSSELWGLFCLNENPASLPQRSRERYHPPYVRGCFIKTKAFGLTFVACLEDLQMSDLWEQDRKAQVVA